MFRNHADSGQQHSSDCYDKEIDSIYNFSNKICLPKNKPNCINREDSNICAVYAILMSKNFRRTRAKICPLEAFSESPFKTRR
jgi:hypothetical protein